MADEHGWPHLSVLPWEADLTPEDLALLRDAERLDAEYAEAQAFDALHHEELPEDWEDETEILHKAGLSRGQP